MRAGAAPLALTCGEPAGIGPEIIARSFDPSAPACFAIGNPAHFEGYGVQIVPIEDPAAAPQAMQSGLPVLVHDVPGPATPGTPQAAQAPGVISAIARAVALTQSGAASAVVTAPIHKKALQDGAQFAYPGHTEYLAALAGSAKVVMMLASDALRVVPATIHIALSDVPRALTPQGLEQVIRLTAQGLISDFGIPAPRIAVAGLNPHAGEGGAMGREEIDWIAGLIARLRAEGLDLTGPLSADTMFHERARAGYDAAVCMYHDQALIPIKTLDFDRGVNVTLGLPFIRTSPDHGTAFDIAGKGIANPTSMAAATQMAATMVARRARARAT
jgi:4-hydroxythreonine-4-phosphate dehydrogenase